MQRNELLQRESVWMQKTDDQQIVLCSRVRLARNLEKSPFPHILSQEAAQQVVESIVEAMENIRFEQENITVTETNTTLDEADKLTYLRLNALSEVEIQVLEEKHLISKDLVNSKRERGVALTRDHRTAIMVNEEDHLRIQVLDPGDMLAETYRMASKLDDALEQRLDFAFREAQGYLTACPTNVGTGLRASVMMHLPALVMTNQAQQVLGTLSHMGLAVRGLYGEGSQALGHIFQISNQITLGKNEEDIIAHLQAVTKQIVEMEVNARENMRRQVPLTLEDKVWRARGTLQNARLLTFDEGMHQLSLDRLGTDMGVLPLIKYSFASILVNAHPGCLQYRNGSELEQSQRDAQRARNIREAMKQKANDRKKVKNDKQKQDLHESLD